MHPPRIHAAVAHRPPKLVVNQCVVLDSPLPNCGLVLPRCHPPMRADNLPGLCRQPPREDSIARASTASSPCTYTSAAPLCESRFNDSLGCICLKGEEPRHPAGKIVPAIVARSAAASQKTQLSCSWQCVGGQCKEWVTGAATNAHEMPAFVPCS
eukprot:359397-Chlamydomonas_euryale.AAC.8